MLGAKAWRRGRTVGWPILFAAMVSVGGCGGTKSPDLALSTSESRPLDPIDDSGSALRLARATRSAGDLASAIQIYRKLIANNSAPAEIKVELGDVLVESQSPDDAIDIYSQVEAKAPARLGATLGLTRAYIALGEPAKALDYADEARRLGPQDPRALVDRGVALDSLERHAEAQDCYRTVLAATPRHVSARNDLALSLALSGQYDEAIAIISPLARSSSATPRVRENMAVIYGLKGDAENAAIVSRADLDDDATKDNLAFLAAVRATTP